VNSKDILHFGLNKALTLNHRKHPLSSSFLDHQSPDCRDT